MSFPLRPRGSVKSSDAILGVSTAVAAILILHANSARADDVPCTYSARLRNSYKLAKVQRDAAELAYAEAIQHALGDVAVQLYRALGGGWGT